MRPRGMLRILTILAALAALPWLVMTGPLLGLRRGLVVYLVAVTAV